MQRFFRFSLSLLFSLRTFGISINNKIIIIQSFRYIPRSHDLLAKAGQRANRRPEGAAEIASRRLGIAKGNGRGEQREAGQLSSLKRHHRQKIYCSVSPLLLFYFLQFSWGVRRRGAGGEGHPSETHCWHLNSSPGCVEAALSARQFGARHLSPKCCN